MIPPKRTAGLPQQFAQSCRGYAVVEHSADHQIGTLLALVLAEPARQANGSFQSVALHMLIYDGEILGVSSRETGTPKTDLNFQNAVFREHGHLILPATA
jgi:hypothetical protein